MSDTPIRVLFVAPDYKPNWGGIERAIDRLSAELRAAGHATGIIATHYTFPRQHRAGLPARETIDGGKPVTPFMSFGDHIRIEMFDRSAKSIFGAIDQKVVRYTPPG